ncbi:MAG: MBL fold metallo-hydrolase RNA specificity domain-containing protein [Actinomycetota bacterium]
MSSQPNATLQFLGAAGTVTGSKYLLTLEGRRILVDAGMFQGEKQWRLRNWEDFPLDPATITDVVLTHAHLDHSGYLPALVKQGFIGPVWCTEGTRRLTEIVLKDAGYLQERDAEDAAEGGWSKHDPPLPLYTVKDVEDTLTLLQQLDFDADFDLGDGIVLRFTRAGHILGSASVNLTTAHASVLFSGDLGRHDHPVLRPREVPPGAQVVVVESTYGNRDHPEPENLPHELLADVIRRTAERGGSVLIPAFAVDRMEGVLKVLHELRRDGRIPSLPTYVNSPMALDALDVYRDMPEELKADFDLDAEIDRPQIHEVRTADESRELTAPGKRKPAVFLSSSGMLTGGRSVHHLERMLPHPDNAIVLAGYQAAGTRGAALLGGATQLKMHGRYVPVKAEIARDGEFSVHADASELLDWLVELHPRPSLVFCTHGEPDSALALGERIERDLGVNAVVPRHGEVVVLDTAAEDPQYHERVAGAVRVPRPERAELAAHVAHPEALAPQRIAVTSDLGWRAEGGDVVLEGTIRIRLRRADLRAALAAGVDVEVVGRD